MARDIVQFVEFRKYRGRGQESRLAKEVVAEIPDQILSYAKAHNIAPQPPRQYSDHVRPVSGPAAVSYGAAAEEVATAIHVCKHARTHAQSHSIADIIPPVHEDACTRACTELRSHALTFTHPRNLVLTSCSQR